MKSTKYSIQAAAMLVPIDETPIDSFGCLKNKITINADITKPIEDEWEANQ